MQIHEALSVRLEASERSLRDVAEEAGVDPGNLSRFLSQGRGVGVPKVERLLSILDVQIAEPAYPPHLAWLAKADHWYALLKDRLPEMDAAELRQIVVSLHRPSSQRRFLLRRVGDGFAL